MKKINENKVLRVGVYILTVIVIIFAASFLTGCGSKAHASEKQDITFGDVCEVVEAVSEVYDVIQGAAPVENVDRAEYNDGIVSHCLNGVGYYSTWAGFLTLAYDVDGGLLLCAVQEL